jgi:hypothetical protein
VILEDGAGIPAEAEGEDEDEELTDGQHPFGARPHKYFCFVTRLFLFLSRMNIKAGD